MHFSHSPSEGPQKLCCIGGRVGIIFRRFRICEAHMKAAANLLAVLLMLSSTSLAQTAPVQEAAPVQQTAPVQETVPTQQAVPAQQAAAGGESANPEAAKTEAEGQASTPSPSAIA